MANYQIAFDNADSILGNYFEQSKVDLINFINTNDINHTINEIPSPQCNQAYIDIIIPQINHQNFIFVAYSHGMPDHLQANASFYVRSGVNSDIFTRSLFYSMCCHAGKHLGVALISSGCHAFIGYKDEAWALNSSNMQLSIECDNFGIKKFISGDTLQNSFEAMKQNFNIQIDALENNGEILAAAYLRRNRDVLIMLGNGNIRFSDF
jgi:hypothetical protein